MKKISLLAKLTEQFDSLDKGSFSFRYPIDTKGNFVFDIKEQIDLSAIECLFESTMAPLGNTIDVFSIQTDYLDTNTKDFQEEMNAYYNSNQN